MLQTWILRILITVKKHTNKYAQTTTHRCPNLDEVGGMLLEMAPQLLGGVVVAAQLTTADSNKDVPDKDVILNY